VTFAVGRTVTVREVWAGEVWLEFPEMVVGDGDVLATLQRDGTPFTFPEHAGGPHPWSHQTHWRGTTVLKLRRPGEWYSVWKFFDAGADGDFRGWYVNFERPYVRRADGIDIDDLELDLVLHPDGRREWKDVEALDARLRQGRFQLDDLRHVLAAAPVVVDLLDRDDRWWSPWDEWTPGSATMAP
jgi:hypothetical protein